LYQNIEKLSSKQRIGASGKAAMSVIPQPSPCGPEDSLTICACVQIWVRQDGTKSPDISLEYNQQKQRYLCEKLQDTG